MIVWARLRSHKLMPLSPWWRVEVRTREEAVRSLLELARERDTVVEMRTTEPPEEEK